MENKAKTKVIENNKMKDKDKGNKVPEDNKDKEESLEKEEPIRRELLIKSLRPIESKKLNRLPDYKFEKLKKIEEKKLKNVKKAEKKEKEILPPHNDSKPQEKRKYKMTKKQKLRIINTNNPNVMYKLKHDVDNFFLTKKEIRMSKKQLELQYPTYTLGSFISEEDKAMLKEIQSSRHLSGSKNQSKKSSSKLNNVKNPQQINMPNIPMYQVK